MSKVYIFRYSVWKYFKEKHAIHGTKSNYFLCTGALFLLSAKGRKTTQRYPIVHDPAYVQAWCGGFLYNLAIFFGRQFITPPKQSKVLKIL